MEEKSKRKLLSPLPNSSKPLSRPPTGTVKQWFTNMKDRGLIVSDAEIKYRHWLTLSATNHSSSTTNLQQRPAHRPQTAPADLCHTKTTLLRIGRQCLPKAETDYNLLAKKRKQFDLHYNKVLRFPIMTDNCPEHETFQEFVTGARYNNSRHIDSRSLERLGVYVPRGNINATFVNPGGISPFRFNKTRHDSKTVQDLFKNMPSFSNNISSLSNISGSLDLDSEYSDVRNISLLGSNVQLKDNVPASFQTNKCNTSIPQEITAPSVNDDLKFSVEAQRLANEIIEESLSTNFLDDASPNQVVKSKTDEESSKNSDAYNQEIHKTAFEQQDNTIKFTITEEANDNDVTDCQSISSTLFIDMTKLHN